MFANRYFGVRYFGDTYFGQGGDAVPVVVTPAAYPAYPRRRRIQVQRRDGTIVEVESESEAVTLLESLARRAEQAALSTGTRKAAKALKPAVQAAELVRSGPAVDFFSQVEQPKRPISEATFVKIMRAAIVAAAEMQEEDDVESMLLAA